MVSEKVTITNPVGLHARPASMFVQTAGRFKARIEVVNGSARLNAKSIMGIMSGAIAQGTKITIEADGEDEQEALETLVALVKNNFYEST